MVVSFSTLPLFIRIYSADVEGVRIGFFDGAAEDWSDLNLFPTLERGWAFVSVEYRLVPQVGLEEQVEDVKDAVRFVREELGERMGENKVDAKRVAVSGSSAGTLLLLSLSMNWRVQSFGAKRREERSSPNRQK